MRITKILSAIAKHLVARTVAVKVCNFLHISFHEHFVKCGHLPSFLQDAINLVLVLVCSMFIATILVTVVFVFVLRQHVQTLVGRQVTFHWRAYHKILFFPSR